MPRLCLLIVAVLLVAPGPARPATATGTHPTWAAALASADEPGDPFVLEGRVIGANGLPMRDVLIHIYHADASGRYSREGRVALDGLLRTNVLGRFRVRTVLPGIAEGNPHVHLEIAGPADEFRAITLSLCRSTGAGNDKVFEGLPWLLELPGSGWAYVHRDADGVFQCKWDLPYSKAVRLGARPAVFSRIGR